MFVTNKSAIRRFLLKLNRVIIFTITFTNLFNTYLARRMEKSENTNCKMNQKKARLNIWKYFVSVGGVKQDVCQTFILQLFQVSIKRLRIIQSKILLGDSFQEKRKSHNNHPYKLDESVLNLMKTHLQSFIQDKSHYCQQKTSLIYFEKTDLFVKSLYIIFLETLLSIIQN